MVWKFRFRRSIGNRFFRLNFTKTGVGASAGVPGYRKTWHSTGRKTETVSIPGTGMSWQNAETAKQRRQRAAEAQVAERPPPPPPPPGGTVEDAIDLIEDIDP